MRRGGWMVAVWIVVAVGALAAGAREPTPARSAQTTCADLAPVTDFNTFVLGDHRINNNDVYGRMAIGGNAILNDLQQGEISIGNGLPRDLERLDLIVRGDIVAPGNVDVDRGSVVYAGTLQGSVRAAGTVTAIDAADLPFDFDDTFVRLNTLQDTWADLPDQSEPEIIGAGGSNPRVRFGGTDSRLNAFSVSAATLQRAETIEIGVPGGTATTLINVTGGSYTSADRPTVAVAFNTEDPVGDEFGKVGAGDLTSPAGQARARLVWSFPGAEVVQIGTDDTTAPSMAWEGTVFAPKATVLLGRSARLHGTIVAQRLEQTGTARLPGLADGACLPPPCPPTEPTDPTDPTEPTEPEPEPPPLPPEPIQPSPPGDPAPPEGAVAGSVGGATTIVLCKRAKRPRVVAGETVTYRLEVRNVGVARAEDVVVCDPVPAGLRIVRARGAQVRGGRACWRIASLEDERTMHLTVRANSTARGGIRNVARARAANAGNARASSRIRVLPADPFDGRPPGKGAQANAVGRCC